MCCYCDRPDPRDPIWRHRSSSRNSRRWRWTVNQCSSTRTCPYPSDCLMSRSRIYCSRHSAGTDSLIRPFPLFRTTPTVSLTTDSTDMPKSNSAPANMDSFGWQNIERRLIEWLWFVDLVAYREENEWIFEIKKEKKNLRAWGSEKWRGDMSALVNYKTEWRIFNEFKSFPVGWKWLLGVWRQVTQLHEFYSFYPIRRMWSSHLQRTRQIYTCSTRPCLHQSVRNKNSLIDSLFSFLACRVHVAIETSRRYTSIFSI